MTRAQKDRKNNKTRGRRRGAGRLPQKNRIRKRGAWKSNHNSVLKRRKGQPEEDQNYRLTNAKPNAKRPNSSLRMLPGKRRPKPIHLWKSYRVSIDIPALNNMLKISRHKNRRTPALSSTTRPTRTSPKSTFSQT